MKKYLCAAIIAAMLFCICACGGGSPESGSSSPEEPYFGSFSAVDFQGNSVTDSLFAEKDYTVVNIWATYCGPCIGEMPELQALAGSLPSNMQLIGICSDCFETGSAEYDAAVKILSESGVSYTNLLLSEDLADVIYENIQAVPTTLFLDSKGCPAAKPVIGADLEAYRAAIEKLSE